MFSIEHKFNTTVITLGEEGTTPLQENVNVNGHEECITVQQYNPCHDRMQMVTLSIAQMHDLVAAISLPEGVYSLSKAKPLKPKRPDNQPG